VGSGHRIAAEAIAAQIKALSASEIRVEVLDALDFGPAAYTAERATSTFTGWSSGIYDRVWSSDALGRTLMAAGRPYLRWAYRRMIERVADLAPSAVVCTHALAANLAITAERAGRLHAKVVCVATDFGLHGMWPARGVSLFCAADEASATELLHRGYAPGNVAVTGVPVRPQFAVEYDREASRKYFDLPLDRRLILALAGSTVPGPYVHLKSALSVALPAAASLPNTTVAIVTGRDEKYAAELRGRAKGFGTTNVRIFGFVEHMAPLIAAADLVIAKPGGLVCAECVDVNVPMVLIGPAVGQERANANAMTEAGVALFAADPRTLNEWVRKAVTSPARLSAMTAATQKLAKPHSAHEVASRVLDLVGVPVKDREGE
jgi:processive 1,2-diacylglycerol beta-glucosyltransferase